MARVLLHICPRAAIPAPVIPGDGWPGFGGGHAKAAARRQIHRRGAARWVAKCGVLAGSQMSGNVDALPVVVQRTSERVTGSLKGGVTIAPFRPKMGDNRP